MFRKRMLAGIALAILTALLIAPGVPHPARGAEYVTLPNGGRLDLSATCPVCGMPVGGGLESPVTYAYKDGRLHGFAGVAAAVFKDGRVVGFEGARCLFIYNTIPRRFGIDVANVMHRYVTDFTTKRLIDVNEAFFVMGSPIRGLMGYDLIPFDSEEGAKGFMSQYGGKRIVQLKSIGLNDVERDAKGAK